MKKFLFIAVAALLAAACGRNSGSGDPEMDRFIDDLISRMTVEEKLGQMNLSGGDIPGVLLGSSNIDDAIRGSMLGSTGWYPVADLRRMQSIAVNETRIGIPLMCGLDVIHGLGTIFPIPLALSCMWDTTLVQQSARLAAVEATAKGVCWTYSPMVDIARDARWGRIAEGAGEDPWLGSRIAAAMVRGYQGDDLADSTTILSCVKHFALYGAAEAGRDYNTVDMSRIQMYNDYMPPYKAAVEAGVGSVMSSFNVVDCVPATGNRWLLTELLRDEWGFDGFVVSDHSSIGEMTSHGMGDFQDVSVQALKAGLDMDMMTRGYIRSLKQSLSEGRVSMKDIDQACRRILEAKYKLGLFEDPFRYIDEEREKTEWMTDESMQFARKLAQKSIVLLRNDEKLLPLQKKGKIAVVGPMAFTKTDLLGMWSFSYCDKSLTIEEAVREAVGDKAEIVSSYGCNLTNEPFLAQRSGLQVDEEQSRRYIREAVSKACASDVVVAVVGEPRSWSGEAACMSDISLDASQKELLSALLETGKPIVLVLANGRPMTLEWEDSNFGTIVEAWHGGSQAARALADVLFGDVNPSGKLTATFPRNMGQIPLYYNAKKTGRPMNPDDYFTSKYLDCPNDPVYPFGYGLSYTEFKYGDIHVDRTELYGEKDALTVSVDVTNAGRYDGEEIVQLYIGDPVASISRPVKELKGYDKVFIKAGETKTVEFRVTVSDLKFYNADLKHVWEPGRFNISVGTNSHDVQTVSVNWSI